jgi:hypothetical protein
VWKSSSAQRLKHILVQLVHGQCPCFSLYSCWAWSYLSDTN